MDWTAFAQELEKIASGKPAEGAPRPPVAPPSPKVKASKPPRLAQVLPPKPPTIDSNLSKTAMKTKMAVLGRVARALSKGERKLRANKYIGRGVPILAGLAGINLALKAAEARKRRRHGQAPPPELRVPPLEEF